MRKTRLVSLVLMLTMVLMVTGVAAAANTGTLTIKLLDKYTHRPIGLNVGHDYSDLKIPVEIVILDKDGEEVDVLNPTKGSAETTQVTDKYDVEIYADGFMPFKTNIGIWGEQTLTAMLEYAGWPKLASVSPAKKATGVKTDAVIKLNFDQKMDLSTANKNTIKITPFVDVEYSIVDFKTVKIVPVDEFDFDTEYEVTITTSFKNPNGLSLLEDYVFTFTTVEEPKEE